MEDVCCNDVAAVEKRIKGEGYIIVKVAAVDVERDPAAGGGDCRDLAH